MKYKTSLNNNSFNKGLLLVILLSAVPTVVGAAPGRPYEGIENLRPETVAAVEPFLVNQVSMLLILTPPC